MFNSNIWTVRKYRYKHESKRGYLDQTVFVMTSQQQNQGNYDYNVWDITVECC